VVVEWVADFSLFDRAFFSFFEGQEGDKNVMERSVEGRRDSYMHY
jgi:hypothetical protein